jgi:7 transmembrane sweet-taste receptor of 3 GCPR
MTTCALVLVLVVLSRHEKIIKKSQPVFIYIFIVGAFMMNLCILAMIGPNTDSSCLLRPWCINISSTLMFAPLLMKLHRIDLLFRLSKKLKKVKIPDHKVC